ncbi:MAG: hypothetical protein J6B77_01260 [Clostridia bacterium]|nr:hypothetical protein [Clostridia bacterium]
MLSVMLFEDSEIKETKKTAIEDAQTVGKCPGYLVALYVAVFALCIALGVILLVFRPISQYLAAAICLFAVSVVPLFFLIDAFVFRISVGKGKIAVRKLGAKETVYAYTDVAWQMQTPDRKRSAIVLYAKGKIVAHVYYGAKNYALLTTLRHKGALTEGERAIVASLSTKK